MKISENVEKSEKKCKDSIAVLSNPLRHTTKFSKIPVAFVALKTDTISSGLKTRCITTDELGKELTKFHKGVI